MFFSTKQPRGTENENMDNLFAQMFERIKRLIMEYAKCLLAGVSPPSWLWSSSLPSQTSELSKEEIILGLLSIPYQQPVSFRADNGERQDLTSVVNNPSEEQLLEEEEKQQQELSGNLATRVSNHSHEQDANIACPKDVHQEERLSESTVSTGWRENQSCQHSDQKQRVENSLDDATSPGRSQGEMVPKTVPTTGCEREPEPNTCVLPLDKILRSTSRQKDFERRSSAKPSKSRSNSRNELTTSPGGNITLDTSLRSKSAFSEVNFFKHDGNEVENSDSQGKEGDQCNEIRSSSQTDNRVVEPVVVDHSSCGSKVQLHGALNKAGSNQCHVRLSRPKSLAIDEEAAPLQVRAENSLLRSHHIPAFDDNGERSFDEAPNSSRVNSTMEKVPTPGSAANNQMNDHNDIKKEACHNLRHYDVTGSAPSDLYEVELQKMIGSSSSADLRIV